LFIKTYHRFIFVDRDANAVSTPKN